MSPSSDGNTPSCERQVSATPEEAARGLAGCLVAHLRRRLTEAPDAHLALSGGSSAALLGAALAREDGLSTEDWARIHVWLVDERCVPADDSRLNFNLLKDVLLGRVALPAENLHPMPVQDPTGAARYEAELRSAFMARTNPEDRRLDAVVLGMGPDGHTASLFPGTPALAERERLVVLNDGDKVVPPRPRMTMTFPILNRARLIALLVTGAAKRPALARAWSNEANADAVPVAGIVPAPGSRLVWFLDQEAVPKADFCVQMDDESTTPVSGRPRIS